MMSCVVVVVVWDETATKRRREWHKALENAHGVILFGIGGWTRATVIDRDSEKEEWVGGWLCFFSAPSTETAKSIATSSVTSFTRFIHPLPSLVSLWLPVGFSFPKLPPLVAIDGKRVSSLSDEEDHHIETILAISRKGARPISLQ